MFGGGNVDSVRLRWQYGLPEDVQRLTDIQPPKQPRSPWVNGNSLVCHSAPQLLNGDRGKQACWGWGLLLVAPL